MLLWVHGWAKGPGKIMPFSEAASLPVKKKTIENFMGDEIVCLLVLGKYAYKAGTPFLSCPMWNHGFGRRNVTFLHGLLSQVTRSYSCISLGEKRTNHQNSKPGLLLCSFGLFISSFASKLFHLLLTYGCLYGFGKWWIMILKATQMELFFFWFFFFFADTVRRTVVFD